MKKLLIINLIFGFICLAVPFAVKADDKTTATVSHVISETIKGSFFSEFKFHTKSNEIIPTNTKGNSIR